MGTMREHLRVVLSLRFEIENNERLQPERRLDEVIRLREGREGVVGVSFPTKVGFE